MTTLRLDRDIRRIVDENGIVDVIGALARYCNDMEMPRLFRLLNKIYERYVAK